MGLFLGSVRTFPSLGVELCIDYNINAGVSQLLMRSLATGDIYDMRIMIVWADGALRGASGGPGWACASWGVFFGPESPYNARGRVNRSEQQSNVRGEIEALTQALHIIEHRVLHDLSMQQVHIVLNSSYIFYAVTEQIPGWVQNGGRHANGSPVAFLDALRHISDRINYMTYEARSTVICLCLVPPELNWEANALANRALDEY